MPTLAQVLSSSRIHEVRAAIVASLAEGFAGVSVEAHPGKLDISDVLAGEATTTPAMRIGVTSQRSERRVTGLRDVVLRLSVYVVVDDVVVEPLGLRYRDEIGPALCDALVDLLGDDVAARWGLDLPISPPEDVEAKPLFTSKDFARGAAYYAVSWQQTILNQGSLWIEPEGEPPAGWQLPVLLPGDPEPAE